MARERIGSGSVETGVALSEVPHGGKSVPEESRDAHKRAHQEEIEEASSW